MSISPPPRSLLTLKIAIPNDRPQDRPGACDMRTPAADTLPTIQKINFIGQPRAVRYPWCAVALPPGARHNVQLLQLVRRELAGRSSGVTCGMRHPSPAACAIRNNPAPTTTAPMARATRSPAGARRSTVMAAVTMAIARRSMTPMTSRIAVRPAQQ